MNDTKGLEEFQTNFTEYPEYGIYFPNNTDYADALATDSEEASSSKQRSRVCQIHLNFQFAFAGCIAGLLCIIGITGNVIAYLIFTRGRQKSAVIADATCVSRCRFSLPCLLFSCSMLVSIFTVHR